jgi:hypothetical protein
VNEGIHTLCSKTGQATDRSPTNILVGILQQFYNIRNCWPDLLLQCSWGAASEAQMDPSGRGNTYFVLQDWTGTQLQPHKYPCWNAPAISQHQKLLAGSPAATRLGDSLRSAEGTRWMIEYILCAPRLDRQLIAARQTYSLECSSNFTTPEIAGRISCCNSAGRQPQKRKGLQVDEGIHTLRSKAGQAVDCSPTNILVGILQQSHDQSNRLSHCSFM